MMAAIAAMASFNTQPPEGGWTCIKHIQREVIRFNTQPPEGGWWTPPAPV